MLQLCEEVNKNLPSSAPLSSANFQKIQETLQTTICLWQDNQRGFECFGKQSEKYIGT